MNVVFDTNILRQDRGFLNSDILLLKKLSKLGLLKIHFPWVVYKECTSQNFIEVDSIIGKAIKEISSLNRKGISKDEFKKLQQIAENLDSIKTTLDKSTEKHWADFIEDSMSILHEIDNEHGKKVMSSYFLGDKPFPVPKSRKDIPDAFIFESIKSIRKDVGKVHFICHDNNLRKAVMSLDNCHAFESYSKFYESSDYKEIEDRYKKIEHFSDELILLKDNVDMISEFAISEIYGDDFASNEQDIVHESLPSDGNEGVLQSVDDVKVENIYIDKIQFIDSVFYIPLDISAIFEIHYFIFKADYYLVAEDRNISLIDDEWNKHYYLIEESFNVKLSYKCSITQESIKNGDFEFSSQSVIIEEFNIIRK